MKFMLDHNLAPGLARALNELSAPFGHQVAPLREMIPVDSADEHWIARLGREGGWAVVSGDIRVFEAPAAVAAWREAKLTIFFLAPGWSDLTYWPKATKLVGVWEKVIAFATGVTAGTLYEIRAGGKFDVLSPPAPPPARPN